MKRVIIFPNKDEKSNSWCNEINNIECFQVNGNIFYQFYFVALYALRGYEVIFFFRYLGDYRNIFMTFIKMFLECLICFICKLSKGQVRWIVHNIDKESFEFFPKITKIRRNIVAYHCEYAYVTDCSLIEHLQNKMPNYKGIIDVTCFGDKATDTDVAFNRQITDVICDLKKNHEDIRFSLCATSLSLKCYHLFKMSSFLDVINKDGLKLVMILVAPFNKYKNSKVWDGLYSELSSRKDIMIFPDGGRVSEKYLTNHIDFVYRTLDDISIPYSLYTSVSAKLPLVTHNVGMLRNIVLREEVGVVYHSYSCEELFCKLEQIKKDNFDRFNNNYNWEKGAQSLVKGLF
ncbi:TPA: hypothetical protein ACPJ1F_002459 [Vibrio diabolicus]